MASKCSSHPSNATTILCEECGKNICDACCTHKAHQQIKLMDVPNAYENLESNNQVVINCIKSLERKVQNRRDEVKAEVDKAASKLLSELEDIRKKEVAIAKSIEAIKQGGGSTEEKYLKTKQKLKTSQSLSSRTLVFIPSHYISEIIPRVIGRLEYVAADQELVELCSFNTLSRNRFIKSMCIVDSTKAWILYYRDTSIHLVDYNGRVIDTQAISDKAIEDFCITTTGDVIFTDWDGSDLKRWNRKGKVKGSFSLHEFENGYTTRGLCKKGEDVLVCLCSVKRGMQTRVAKMSVREQSARELKFTAANTDFLEPGRVSCKSSDPVIIAVVDWGESGRRIKAIDKEGKFLWEWKGEMGDGSEVSPFVPFDITFCNIKQQKRFLVTCHHTEWNKIYSISVNGGDAKCIYTGVNSSCDGAIIADPDGRIWIGDQNGVVHIMSPI
ncbi:uncharacterized protein [Argopecten irradians]|uniref:uncharacterized protein n=1 Tax=Argopecten irradians TaxID=31199 RepID=UPI0037222180